MRIGLTIERYFAAVFLRWFLVLFSVAAALVLLIDALELFRDLGGEATAAPLTVVAVSALRVPQIAEQILPFAMLVASIGAFLTLSRRLELVTARAAGLSVWQFARPGLIVAVAIGALSTALFNPLAARLKALSVDLAEARFAEAGSALDQTASPSWLRQRTPEGEAVLNVGSILAGGATVLAPTFWLFDGDGALTARVSARQADLRDGAWHMRDAEVVAPEADTRRETDYAVPTRLTPEQVYQRFAAPEDVGFWGLGAAIGRAESAGLPLQRFRVHRQELLARPVLLAAMVLIAATVSLGSSRQGGVARRILIGVVLGFMLYVALQVCGDLGEAGLVAPILAAWIPGLVALALGTTVLLFREDG